MKTISDQKQINISFCPNEGWEATIITTYKLVKLFGNSKTEINQKLFNYLNQNDSKTQFLKTYVNK